MTPRFFATEAAFRSWLKKYHAHVDALWVGFHKKASGKPSITYPQAVDQALCFGWIDGLRKPVDADSYMIRFTPRKPRSIWSAVNLRKYAAMEEKGLVEKPGLDAFERRDPARTNLYSFENRDRKLDAKYEKVFRANREAWTYFTAQAPSYQRIASWWVVSAKKEETRMRRLQRLIDVSAAGKWLPQMARRASS